MNENIVQDSKRLASVINEINKVIIGQEETIDFMLLGVLCQGHILLEGVPGVAKTTMIKALNKTLGLDFKRIQFTPDLLPSDLIGTLVYNPKTHEFETKKGPIFANLILADEINRAPAKVQSALLEAMQEQQVTISSSTYLLDKPFMVFATQNPLEQEGTYRLPEAQLDRFMFKLIIGYPTAQQEKAIITSKNTLESIKTVLTKEDIFHFQQIVENIFIDEKIIDYITKIVFATRQPESFGLENFKKYINYGVSPRATIALYSASKGYAFMRQRNFVIPDDVKAVAPAVLRHRLILSYEAEIEDITTDFIIRKILSNLPTP